MRVKKTHSLKQKAQSSKLKAESKKKIVKRQAVVDGARKYLGVRFRHQGRTGSFCDCAGLLVLTGKNLEIDVIDITAYGRMPDSNQLVEILEQQLEPIEIDEARPGDIYLMHFGGPPQHMAIKTDIGIIHSYALARKVVEHDLNDSWRSRIHAAYRIPGIED